MIDKKAIEESGHRAAHSSTRQKQKENLKTLVENSSVSRVRSAGRVVKYGAASFVRNVWLSIAATLVMTITLIILLITVGASLLLSATAETIQQKIDITVYFAPNTSLETLQELAAEMELDENVREVTVADSTMEYERFLEENADNTELLAALDDPDMRQRVLDTMPAPMRIKVYDPMDLSSIRERVNNSENFQATLDPEKEPTYDVNQAQIETINSWATIAKNGGLILGAVFLVISVLVIFNTIRMAIFSRREEIYMMKLVGADTSFIRGPFLVEAEICGIISGILASTAAYIGFHMISPGLASYGIDVWIVSDLMETSKLVLVYLAVIAIGMIIGSISARLAMQKYLK